MRLIILILIGLITVNGAMVAGGNGLTVAIVVNKANSTDELSAKQLKQIFAGEKARWADGQKIQTLATSPETPEHRAAIQFLFGMSEPEFQKYAMHATFVGNSQAVPRDYGESQAVLRFVGLIPGAIGFVNAAAVNPNVKVVKIDGLAPGDPKYPLVAR